VGKLGSSVSRLVLLEPFSPQNSGVWLPNYPLVPCHFPEKTEFSKLLWHYITEELNCQSRACQKCL